MYHTRKRTVARIKFKNQQQFNPSIKEVYFIKNVKYGNKIDSYDYNRVQVTFFSKREDYTKKETGVKHAFSLARARENVYRIAEANIKKHGKYKPIFFTLTSKDQCKDYKTSNKKVKAFIRRINDYLGFSLKYIIVPELHKSGAIHYHGVFYNLPFVDILFFKENLWTYGSVDLQVAKKIKSTSAYIAKYLTKDYKEATPLHTKLYFTARGMLRPETDFTSEKPHGRLRIENIKVGKYYQRIKYKKL